MAQKTGADPLPEIPKGPYETRPGQRYPPGANPDKGGTNFSVFSRFATEMELLLFEAPNSPEPFQVIRLDPEVNRTFYSWHVYVEGLPPGVAYMWRVDGPNDVRITGRRFDREKALLDPRARAVTHDRWDRESAKRPGDNVHASMRGIVVNDDYNWEEDQPLDLPIQKAVIYELHVGGFTRHPSAGAKHPGTFHALMEKIPYLRELGITHVELMPVMAFDEQDVPKGTGALGLKNYWGYSPHSFFSPHPGYCISPGAGTHQSEFRDMVKTLHRGGIGIILDVVFNHTAENGAEGPVINYKGLSNETFYHLNPQDRSHYLDFTGCGNTINCNHPVVAVFLLECLEYWVRKMHVDGFRFDLASVLARGEDGNPLYNAPVLWSIEFSDILARTRIIAEAWDAAGLYQVGAFPGYRWAEWNGRYRDVVRRFVRGDRGLIGEVATRLSGSADLYKPNGRLPINSINFVTCHDGFTLKDLVSYNEKHNHANGDQNRDGTNDNFSWNCGEEGETEAPAIQALRKQQAKNMIAILLLSQGVPMILFGDEVLRTQNGNNNAYCQDNETGWFDWRLTETNKDMLRFVQKMIAFRKRHPALMRRRFLTGQKSGGQSLPDVAWHGFRLNEPHWNDPDARFLSYTLAGTRPEEEDIHVILNMSQDTLESDLPAIPGRVWCLAVDTANPSPIDILDSLAQTPFKSKSYKVWSRSVVVLESRPSSLT
jgi:isoamylase